MSTFPRAGELQHPVELGVERIAAKASQFGETIVHGGVTSSILNAVVAEDLPAPARCS